MADLVILLARTRPLALLAPYGGRIHDFLDDFKKARAHSRTQIGKPDLPPAQQILFFLSSEIPLTHFR
jgi:hypothetical protein